MRSLLYKIHMYIYIYNFFSRVSSLNFAKRNSVFFQNIEQSTSKLRWEPMGVKFLKIVRRDESCVETNRA